MKHGIKLTACALALSALVGAAAVAAPTKIEFWHIGTAATDKAFYQGVVDAYTKAHPDVTINLTILENEAFKSKLTTVMQSGTPPDVFHSWGLGVLAEYAKAGLLKDITKDVKGTAWGNSMAPGARRLAGLRIRRQTVRRPLRHGRHHLLVQQGPPRQGRLQVLSNRLG